MNLVQFELDVALLPDMSIPLPPKQVEGRTIQIDGDFMCYEMTFDDTLTLSQIHSNTLTYLTNRMALSGADNACVHMTDVKGDKGGRYAISKIQPYQENRTSSEKPKYWQALRDWILALDNNICTYAHNKGFNVLVALTVEEADDGMATYQNDAHRAGKSHLSAIYSGDKDLGMVHGYRLDPKTMKLEWVDGYGSIELDRSGSSTKIRGVGTAFFWAQMLLGDAVDNILGCPHMGDKLTKTLYPPTKWKEARRRLHDGTMPAGKDCTDRQLELAQLEYDKPINPKKLGPVAVFDLLKDCTNDKQALYVVRDIYASCYPVPFDLRVEHTDEFIEGYTYFDCILEQANLLWMRRVSYEKAEVFIAEVIDEEIRWRPDQPKE